MNTIPINKPQLKIFLGITLSFVMGLLTLLLYEAELLRYTWAKAAVILTPIVGICSYLYIRRINKGNKLNYFKAYKDSVLVSSLAFIAYGVILFFLTSWIINLDSLARFTPAMLSAVTVIGGIYLSSILAFIVLPFFKRKNPESNA